MNERTLTNIPRTSLTRKYFCAFAFGASVFAASCSEIQRPKVEPFLAVTVPPRKQELKWSNGKLPKTLDPARAAAAPETDIVRAVYDGLTDLDSKTLSEIPGVAEKWETSDKGRTWTFHLRRDARWSNGERITADDFVRSWRRLGELKEKAANPQLFQNIVGLRTKVELPEKLIAEPTEPVRVPQSEPSLPGEPLHGATLNNLRPQPERTAMPEIKEDTKAAKRSPEKPKFGVEAVDDQTLRVSLEVADNDFPKLVANPIFRPIYDDGEQSEPDLDTDTVTNGAFKISKIGDSSISLERSDTFWNRKAVALERVEFVSSQSAESALDAYKKGDLDVLTNATFEPAALKLLTPYDDFRQTAHSALNFYEFNTQRAPFNDRRVREALAISIDRDKLTAGELEGTMKAAYSFLPIDGDEEGDLSLDIDRAKDLLEKAGYANGSGFPAIRLVINRNDTQQRVARTVARMWKQELNLDTVITVKETDEMEAVRRAGDFDVLRRGVVLPSNDEVAGLESILGSAKKESAKPAVETEKGKGTEVSGEKPAVPGEKEIKKGGPTDEAGETAEVEKWESERTISEADALYDLRAMPLYFPISYSLVKPYVRGFEMNGLDAPSLKEISIDSAWQPKPNGGQ